MTVKKLVTGWAALFSFCGAALAGNYLSLLVEGWPFPPWLYFILLGAALESAYFAAYFLDRRTPIAWRGMELAVWLIPLYFFSKGLGLNLLWNGLLTFAVWLAARGYGWQLVKMERFVSDYVGDQPRTAVNWEFESLASKEYTRLPIEYFWWRLWGFGILIAVLAIAVRGRNVSLDAVRPRLVSLGCGAVLSGLALQSGAYLHRLQFLWVYSGAEVQAGLFRAWFKNLSIFLVVMVLILSLSPVDYSPLPAERVGQMFAFLFSRISLPVQKSEQQGQAFENSADLIPPGVEVEEAGVIGAAITLAVLFLIGLNVILILFVIGMAVVFLARGELEKLRGFPKLAARVYYALRGAFRRLLQKLRSFGTKFILPKEDDSEVFEQEEVSGRRARSAAESFDFGGVRALYRTIISTGGERGIIYKPFQTPREYGRALQRQLSGQQDAIALFFKGYEDTRYGRLELDVEEQESVLMVGQKILMQLESLKKGE